MQNILSKLWLYKQGLLYYSEVILRNKTPVVLYQMGKVGSSSVVDSLKRHGVSPVFHIHRMNKANINKVRKEYKNRGLQPPINDLLGDFIRRELVTKNKRVNFITLFRNPLERNFSAFFQNFERYVGVRPENYKGSIDKLIEIFEDGYDQSIPLNWFDIEIKDVLGIDLFEHKFPKMKGYQTYSKGSINLLVIKTSISDVKKEKAIKEYLNLKVFKIGKINVGENKVYNNLYRKFKDNIKLDRKQLGKINNSKVVKHFLTKAELEKNKRWRKTN